jgi:predicted Rossmann fold nucleotide-binding protein DprA/Smf involved in DNA uptake
VDNLEVVNLPRALSGIGEFPLPVRVLTVPLVSHEELLYLLQADTLTLKVDADAENAVGTLTLLKEGAKLVTDGAEVMEEYLLRYPDRINLNPEPAEDTEAVSAEQEKPETAVTQNENADRSKGAGESATEFMDQTIRSQLARLTDDQLKIIMAIDPGSTHIDDITERTELSTARVLAQLTVLEIKGIVRRETGRRFALNITVEK